MKKAKTAPAGRLEAERRRVREIEREEPLRRRLLAALGEGGIASSDLAKIVRAQKESVSRKLRELREAGLVTVDTDPDDRRRGIYSLTDEGRSELGRHLSFGPPGKSPAPPNRDEEVEFLWEALWGAKTMRRRSHRLSEAAERLEDIRAQAEELGASELALEALVELTITQRQAHQVRKRNASLKVMRGLAFGEQGLDPHLVYPAIAHLEYERGKSGDLGETDMAALARHLNTATSMFGALVEERPKSEKELWRSRCAWSVVGLADNLREQSQYEASLRYAASGLHIFDDLDDDYGRTRCWLLFGSCLRLLQRFDVAWSCLQHAEVLATKGGHPLERASAYCLMQMGEVRRCQGRTEEARALLGDGFDRAEKLGLRGVMAFAMSGMAATQFQDGDLERSQVILRDAQEVFDRAGHMEGIALNARRQATVARHLSDLGIPPDDREVKALIRRAEEIYLELNSPAGVAACEVERGWMRAISPECGDLDEIVDRLIQMLGTPDERLPLTRDPWVPKVLHEFSKKVGDPLQKEAKGVEKLARQKIEEEGEQGMQSLAAVADGLAQDREDKPGSKVIEMGGESRRKKAPLELIAA
ncbi:MAG TPA: helix-turn-helix domain-containing protein [Solirubrobacterales bacterium]